MGLLKMNFFGISSVFWDVIVGIGALLFLIVVFWLIIWWCIHDETVYFHHPTLTNKQIGKYMSDLVTPPKTSKTDNEVKIKFAKIKKIMKGELKE
jgi:hypothetical protein